MYGSPISPFHHNPGSPDIRRKLQKLGKGPETPISNLGKEANRVFLNRDQEEEAKREEKGSPKRQENREADPGLGPTTG